MESTQPAIVKDVETKSVNYGSHKKRPPCGDYSNSHERLILVMVGLPARGKSWISSKVVNYLSWTGRKAKLFNVGQFRRQHVVSTEQKHTSDFFSAENVEAKNKREEFAMTVLDALLAWLDEGGEVAVFDATNTTNERREKVLEYCKKHNPSYYVIFIENVCDDEKVLQSNLLQKVRNSPDYKDMPEEDALKDLKERIKNYELVYQPVENDNQSYIKLINLQSKVICNRIYGSLAQKIVCFLLAVHIGSRPIWLARTGHCPGVYDLDPAKLASSAGSPVFPTTASMGNKLSERGVQFSKNLADFIEKRSEEESEKGGGQVMVFTSTIPRAVETASYLRVDPSYVQRVSGLKLIDTGVCSGMSLDQVKETMPDHYHAFMTDTFQYRFPGGESYKDLVDNLEPLVMELERQEAPVLVIGHLSTLQVLYGYFVGAPVEEFMKISIPKHHVVQLLPDMYGWKVSAIPLE